ncbi:hypothetical protein GGX14DRAFT_516982 [Mycena pura]|uniref:Uncharacterized protein n=1 Tax=Mycena pura TaxID=153505 RepID=A0AAD6YJY9_9AGAR|nr:hypothetical protein GGX14DRAFT_516982 [Mycena pura]
MASSDLVPGTPTFFPAILAHVRDLAPPSLPVDPVVFQSILLCLVAGDKHLLLRAPEHDVRLVVKLAFLTLSSVFGLATHKLKIRPRSASPTNSSGAPFLRSLFLPWVSPIESQDEAVLAKPPVTQRNRNNATWSRSSSKRPRRRSISSSNDMIGTTASNPFGDSHEALPSASSSVGNPSGTAPRPLKSRSLLPHTVSDPTPLRPRPDSLINSQPRALVISGLENAALPSQRALTKVLAERRVILEDEDGGYDEVWNLPDGFMMVYVCPFDARERPPIDKTLVDKFAMSATVSPHHTIRALLSSPSRNSASYRNSPALHPAPLPQGQVTPTSSPPFIAQSIPLPHSHSLPVGHHHYIHHPVLQQPIVPPSLLDHLRATYRRTHLSPLLDLYASDLFSAARHHSQLDGMWLTAKSKKDVIELARAGRVIGGDLTGIELVRDDAAYAARARDNVGNGAKAEQDLDGESRDTTRQAAVTGDGLMHRYPIEAVVEEVDGEAPALQDVKAQRAQLQKPDVLELSEADIARIAPRVMTHRLRVRDGPHDEVLGSAMYPADSFHNENDVSEGDERVTIKQILVRILAEV